MKTLLIFALLNIGVEDLLPEKKAQATYYHGIRSHTNDTLTCASYEFPKGTEVRITNLTNNKTVIVRVNDRGPHKTLNGKLFRPITPHPIRKFDLSTKAFQAIANTRDGVINISYKSVL